MVWRKTLTGKVRKLGTIWTDWAIGVPIDVAYDVYDVDDGDDGDDDDDDDDDADADAVDDDDGDDGDDGGAYSKSANAMEIGNYGGWANPRKTQGAESVTHLILWFYADPWLRKC